MHVEYLDFSECCMKTQGNAVAKFIPFPPPLCQDKFGKTLEEFKRGGGHKDTTSPTALLARVSDYYPVFLHRVCQFHKKDFSYHYIWLELHSNRV